MTGVGITAAWAAVSYTMAMRPPPPAPARFGALYRFPAPPQARKAPLPASVRQAM